MGCCQKKKINKESINDELYNENLIPDNITISDSPSNIPSTRISLDASSTSLDDFKKLEVIGQGSFGTKKTNISYKNRKNCLRKIKTSIYSKT